MWGVVGAVLVFLYPAVVYVVLTRYDGRVGVVGLLILAAALATVRWRTYAHRSPALVFGPPVALATLALAGLLLDDSRFVLALPVMINAGLLIAFGSTLRADETPLVERFARLQVQDLSPAELRYCRGVTLAWCVLFVVNGSVSGLLAWLAPVAWWAVYTGVLAYVWVGLLGAAEYVFRKARFGRFGEGPIDRLLERALQQPVEGRK